MFLSLGKFFTIIAKNEQKVNIYTTIPYGTNQSSGYHNHSAPCFSDLAPMRKTFSAITEKRTPKSRFFKFLKILAFLANSLYAEIFLSFLGRSSTCSLIVYPPFKTIIILRSLITRIFSTRILTTLSLYSAKLSSPANNSLILSS